MSEICGLVKNIIKDQAYNFIGIENPEDKYTTPSQILGFRDANQLVELKIASGKLLNNENGRKMTRDQKLQQMIEFVSLFNSKLI